MTEESYFKEKRVINVVIDFPLAKQDATRKIAGELEITSDGVFLTTFYENRSQDEDLKEWPEILTLSGFGSSKKFRLFLNNQIYHSNQRKLDRINSFTKRKFKCEDILVYNNYKILNNLSQITIYIDGLEDFLNKKPEDLYDINHEFYFFYHISSEATSSPWHRGKTLIPSVIFQFQTPIQFCEKKVKELVKKYQIFHSFLTGKNCKIQQVLINADQQDGIEFYSDSFSVIENKQNEFSLLKYDQISVDVISNWFSLPSETFDIYELFYVARFISDKYQRFIGFFTCLEFLVKQYEVNYFDDDVFEKIFTAIKQTVESEAISYPADKSNKFLKTIKSLNTERRPLLDRIVECAEKEGFTALFDKNKQEIKELFQKINTDRNALLHGRSFDGLERLSCHNQILYRSIYFIILQRLGIKKDIFLDKLSPKNYQSSI